MILCHTAHTNKGYTVTAFLRAEVWFIFFFFSFGFGIGDMNECVNRTVFVNVQ